MKLSEEGAHVCAIIKACYLGRERSLKARFTCDPHLSCGIKALR